MKPLRLCYVGPAASVSLRRWAQWFAVRGHETTVLTVEPAEAGLATGFRQVDLSASLGSRKLGRVASAMRLAATVRRLQPDVIHVHYLRGLAWGLLLGRVHPLVATPWGSDVLEEQGAFREWYSKTLTSTVLARADLVTVHSSYMEEAVRPLMPPGRKAVRIGWGVDLALFRPGLDATSLRARWRITPDRRILFSPRLAQPFYNHDRVLRALPLISEKIPEVVLVIAESHPDPPYVAALRRLADELGMAEQVRFVGAIPHADMPFWLTAAEAVVMIPSSDGMPNTLLETLACGAVPVLSRLPQYAELITHGENGWLIEPTERGVADAIIEVLSIRGLRERAAKQNRALAEAVADQGKEMARMDGWYRRLAETRHAMRM